MTEPLPPSSGSPVVLIYEMNQCVDAALATARQARHIADPDLPLIGFRNSLPGYQNACFRNGLFSLLMNIPSFSDWIVSDSQGQLDSSPTAHLLENVVREYFATNLVGKQARADHAMQRLQNFFSIRKPIRDPAVVRYGPGQQQDATEVLAFVLNDIQEELEKSKNIAGEKSFAALYQTPRIAQINCQRCGRATQSEVESEGESWETIIRTQLHSSVTSFDQLIASAFIQNEVRPAHCRRCGGVEPRRGEWKIVKTPEVLFIDINQVVQHPKDATRTIKPGLRVPDIPEYLSLKNHLHPEGVSFGAIADYRLLGVVNHQGVNPNVGHYTSHVRGIDGKWYFMDDAKVSGSSMADLQRYNASLKADQMIPKLLAYVKIHKDEDEDAIRSRNATTQSAPRVFLHPQIVFDNTLGFQDLKALCYEHGLVSSNVKKMESLIGGVNRANTQNSSFGNRSKDWLLKTLLSTGTQTDLRLSKIQLVSKLKNFMATQPPRASTEQPSAIQQRAIPQDNAATQAALNVANKRADDAEAALERSTARELVAELTIAGLLGAVPVTAAHVRALAGRLPTSPSTTPRSKRPREEEEEDDADASPETKKRRVFRNAERICAGIDAAVGEQAGQNNVGSGNPSGPNPPGNEGTPDSNQENRSPRGRGKQTGVLPGAGRCHPCPQFDNEIHHMCAAICNRSAGLITSCSTEQADADRAVMEQTGAVRYTRLGAPNRHAPYPPVLWDIVAWDVIPNARDPTQIVGMRPVAQNGIGTLRPMVLVPQDMSREDTITQLGFLGYVPTPARMRGEPRIPIRRTPSAPETPPLKPPRTRSSRASTDSPSLNLNLSRTPAPCFTSPFKLVSASPVTVYGETFDGDRYELNISHLNPDATFSPILPETPGRVLLTRTPPAPGQDRNTMIYDGEDDHFHYTLDISAFNPEVAFSPLVIGSPARPQNVIVVRDGDDETLLRILDETISEVEMEEEEEKEEEEEEIPDDGDETRGFWG